MTRLTLIAYAKAERGALTALNLFFVIVMAVMGGLAIDMASLIASRQHLQIAADAAAQAAIYLREDESKEDAKSKAIEVAEMNMPQSRYGEVLRDANISFGTWDKASKTFTIDEDEKGAVFVRTDQLAENANPVSAFLLHIAGFGSFDVVTTSVFETYRPTCLREGFVAQGIVDIQSGNDFTNGFCIHSNTNVSVNQNNSFEAGTVVSMPDSSTIDLPSSGFQKNEGLKAALRDGRYDFEILKHLASGKVETDILAGNTDSYNIAGLDTTIVNINPTGGNAKIEMSDLHAAMDDGDPGTLNDGFYHTYEVTCGTNGKLSMDATDPWENVFIITDCNVEFGQNAELRNTTVLVRSTDDVAVKAPSGLTIGDDDGCADGGGAQILTWGGVGQAAKVAMYGGRIVALGDVSFTAGNDGIEGASVVAGGRIDMTSGSDMGFCGTGMNSSFEAPYYRMAG